MSKLENWLKQELGEVEEEERECVGCGITKPKSKFRNTKSRTPGPFAKEKIYHDKYCSDCKLIAVHMVEENVKLYETFEEGYCEITLVKGVPTNDRRSGKSLLPDHCHTTGEHRGMLNKNPNTGLGHLQEDPDIVGSAWVFLEKQLLNNRIKIGEPKSYETFDEYYIALKKLMDKKYKELMVRQKMQLKFLWDNGQGINHARNNKLPL